MLQAFRHPRWFQSKNWKLPTNKTFILPTGFGVAFGFLALIQLMMAIASQNNLIYLFVFSEISVALASMFFTNLNVQKMRIESASIESCFADEDNLLTLSLPKQKQKPSYQLAVRWRDKTEPFEIPPQQDQIQIPWRPLKRGRHTLPSLVLESSFPFGLLRAWKIENLNQEITVYPSRRGSPQFPATLSGQTSLQERGLFFDLRAFQKGDSPQRIDWRASQRSQKILIRRYEEDSNLQLQFDLSQVTHLQGLETQISQLALWIDQAERQGASYSLQIDSWNSGIGQGFSHWHQCLEYLALLKPEDMK